jgi:hypothetical protein
MKIASKQIKHLAVGISTVLMLGAGQAAFAHASILNEISSGATGFSRVGVNHAVNHTTPPTPVIHAGVVFPTQTPTLARSPVGPAIVSLGDYFATTAAGATGGVSPLTTLAGAPQLVQSRDVFDNQIEIANGNNLTVGWWSLSEPGSSGLQVNIHGEVPFRFTAPHFRSALPSANPNGLVAADLCASRLRIWVSVVDIADPSALGSLPTGGAPGSATTGIGFNGWWDNTLLSTEYPPAFVENGAATPVLTINRDPKVNPYPANCANSVLNTPANPAPGTDASFDITVKPIAADIDVLKWGGPAAPFVLR